MIILPDKNIPRAKFLMPVPKRDWLSPSLGQPKDTLGNENQTRFRVRARLHDGHIVWCGWFDDRDDFDAFLWALVSGSLQYERPLWDLPTPAWRPDLGEELSYDFATVTFLTSPTGSNQTYNKPADWVDLGSSIECLGAGGSGGVGEFSSGEIQASGAGAGCWMKITNFSFTGSSATYQIGTGGTAVQRVSSNGTTNGNDGGDTWFNSTTFPGAGSDNTKCGAQHGAKGTAATFVQAGGAGGASASSWGTSGNNGGHGGQSNGIFAANPSGAGGAGGSNGAGNNGVDNGTGSTGSAGGSADAGSGGGAGSAGGGAGGNGTEWDASHGSGGGGGAAFANGSNATGGSGGNYGGGGAGAAAFGSVTVTSGAGIQGIIVTTYTPIIMIGGSFVDFIKRNPMMIRY